MVCFANIVFLALQFEDIDVDHMSGLGPSS